MKIVKKSECIGCAHWYRDSPLPVLSVLRTRQRRDLPLCEHCTELIQTLQCIWDSYSAYRVTISEEMISATLLQLRDHSLKGKLDSTIKYRSAALFSWFNRQALPEPCPDHLLKDGKPLIHFPGFYRCDSILRNSSKNDFFYSFTQALLYLKRGMPRADESKLDAESRSTFHALTRRHRPTSLADRLTGQLWREKVSRRLKEVVREIYRNQPSWYDPTSVSFKIPSRNSHFGRSRRNFGAMHSCHKSYDRTHLQVGEEKYWQYIDKKYINLSFIEWVSPRRDVVLTPVGKHNPLFCQWCDVKYILDDDDSIDSEIPILIDRATTALRFADWTTSRFIGSNQIPFAELHPLAEPCKIRVISKGQDHLYAVLSTVQKVLFDGLNRYNQFLCWRPIDSCILSSILGPLQDGQKYVSGDYKAATNNINPELSRSCMNFIADELNMPDDIRLMCHRALTDHEIVYDEPMVIRPPIRGCKQSKGYDNPAFEAKLAKQYGLPHNWAHLAMEDPSYSEELKDGEWSVGFCSAEQRWGQLMGSPISFPILCLINFAAISVSLHEDAIVLGRRCQPYPKSIREEPIIVNGDDCVFAALPRQIERWQQATKYCGLELSVGKTYYSDQWLIINSTLFRPSRPIPCVSTLRETDRDRSDWLTLPSSLSVDTLPSHRCRFREVPFLNLSLMYGLKRSGSADYDPSDAAKDPLRDGTIGARCSKLIRGLPTDVADYAYSAFISDHRKRLPETISWFTPSELGGMGIPPRPHLGYDASIQDLEIAAASLVRPDIWSPIRIFGSGPGSSETFADINSWLKYCRVPRTFGGEEQPSLEQAFYRDGLYLSSDEVMFHQELNKREQDEMVLQYYHDRLAEARTRRRSFVKDYSTICGLRQSGAIPLDRDNLRDFVWNSLVPKETFPFHYLKL